ncbi:MAG: T9SS type A sorting domain-containing protein [Saprospiraceae bacterium]
MKLKLLLASIFCVQLLSSQTFTEIPSAMPFDPVDSGSIAFSDVDGDGDQDVLITGFAGTRIAQLYTNDGTGTYKKASAFVGVDFSSIAFSDVDGDGDQDVLITGLNTSLNPNARLYLNNGMGAYSYSPLSETLFAGVILGSIAFSDVDGDGDPDVLITGSIDFFTSIAKLYANNGTGTYSEVPGTPFEGVSSGSIAFSDVDSDGDPDVLITGSNNSGTPIAKLYANNGMGNYSEVSGTPFDGIDSGSIAFSDVDNDGDPDVLITGANNNSSTRIAKLYANDGTGNYSEVLGTPFEGVSSASVAFSDVDGDGDQDVFLMGNNTFLTQSAKLYVNDGIGNYSEMLGTPFEAASSGICAFDSDGDNDQDVLIVGQTDADIRIAKLYANDGTGIYSEVLGTPFEGVSSGSVAVSDVDNDGDPDVLLAGRSNSMGIITKLYVNDGAGNYTEVLETPFEGVWISSSSFLDVDGDGDQDVLITGVNASNTAIAKLYINNGGMTFIPTELTALPYAFLLYPNPTKAQHMHLNFLAQVNGSVWVKVFDGNGRPLIQQQKQVSIGAQQVSLDISSLNKGTYIVQLDDGTRKCVQKLLIQ